MTTKTTIDISELSENEIKTAIQGMQPVTPRRDDYVELALLYVRKHHPTCTRVLFDNAGCWRYMDTQNEGFTFGGDTWTSTYWKQRQTRLTTTNCRCCLSYPQPATDTRKERER